MNHKPFFTVITATHNRLELLQRAISSVCAQTWNDWEMIIIDDSTNNETQRWVVSQDLDQRIRYIKNDKNSGVNVSRNRALDEARGIWISFLDDDDYFKPGHLEAAHTQIKKHPDYYWFMSNHVFPDDSVVGVVPVYGSSYTYLEDMLLQRIITGDGTHVFKRSVVTDIRFETDIVNGGEWSFWYHLGKQTELFYHDFNSTVVEYLPEGLSQNVSGEEKRKNIQNILHLLSKDGVSRWLLYKRLGPAYVLSFFKK